MVSLSSFVQILVLIKQMEYTGTQAGASKMSLLTVGSQAVLDVYLCLIHLVAGILIGLFGQNEKTREVREREKFF